MEKNQRDIVFDDRHEEDLKLDFYWPNRGETPRETAKTSTPLIVWVHGGAWRRGSKDSVPIRSMGDMGYAIASVEYRLSETAKFPAQVVDIKRAIHFLHKRSDQFGFDPDRIIIAGASAGGHLAALVGVSFGVPELEPKGSEPIRMAAIVSFYGASNLESILSQTKDAGKREFRSEALRLLLGDVPERVPSLAALASPVSHITEDDPPIFLFHGDADIQMPMTQSMELKDAYRKHGLFSQLSILPGGGHGGPAFYTPQILDQIDANLSALIPASR